MKEIKRYEVVSVDGVPAHRLSQEGRWVKYDDKEAIVTEKDAHIAALQEQVRALAAEKENARDVMLYAANNISYAIFNLSDKKLSDLKRGLSDTTCPTDSALLAERELRSFASRIRAGEKS